MMPSAPEPTQPDQRPTHMTRRALPLLVALTCLAAACGSDGDAPGDTLPNPDVQVTEVPITEVPITEVTVTDPPVAVTAAPIDDDAQVQLDAAVARWSEQGPTSYTMITQQLCFCPQQEWSDTILDGEVTEHVALTDDAFFDPGPTTMPSLFADVQEVIDGGYAALDLEFDPETGALVRYFVDIDERMADEESGVDVLSLEPLS
jgi:hypothetical protein